MQIRALPWSVRGGSKPCQPMLRQVRRARSSDANATQRCCLTHHDGRGKAHSLEHDGELSSDSGAGWVQRGSDLVFARLADGDGLYELGRPLRVSFKVEHLFKGACG